MGEIAPGPRRGRHPRAGRAFDPLAVSGPDGGQNRLFHTGRPPGTLARVILSRRIDFLIREDPLHPGSVNSTIVRPRDFNLRELIGLED